MGLDGISINQLRITPENSASETARNAKLSNQTEHKVVDGLSSGQRVDPDKENHQQNKEYDFDETEQEENVVQDEIEVIQYDLSQSNKYELKIDNDTNTVLIIDKTLNKVVQKIEAEELSNYVHFLSNSQGSIVNRKF